MRIIIAEDNPIEMIYLKKLLNQEDIYIVGEACNGYEAIKMISKLQPDVAFLDISMPGFSGIDIAKKFSEKVIIVFITAHNQFTLNAFEVGSTDYLLKPVTPERIKITLTRIRKLLSLKNIYPGKISINIKGSSIVIDIGNVIFIEKIPLVKKIRIYTANNMYTVSGTLNNFEKKLINYGFIRSHKSFIINISKLEKMVPWGDKSYIAKMYGTKREVLISRNYAPLIRSLIKNLRV